MASFSINYTSTSVTVNVSYVSNYSWYRVYLRTDDGYNTEIHSEYYYRTSDFSVTISDLSPNTPYAINVGHGNANGDSTNFGTTSYFTTSSSSSGSTEGDLSGDGRVWIDGNWYQPYIFNGSKWVTATPCIFNGSRWIELNGE